MTATQFASNFYSIKQKFSTFSTNNEQIKQKLSTITQTRNKISNQLINLTKDYEKKIKQLQNRLDQTLSKNQILSKQNILYQKDIQAFQIRLVEKQKLIALLITQQNERFGDNIFSRTKSEYERGNKDKTFRKTYQSILPKNIQQKKFIVQNQTKKIQPLVQQNDQQVTHHAQQRNQNQSKHEQKPEYVVQQVVQQNYFQKQSQSQNQQQVHEKPVKSGIVPPPPKSKLRPPVPVPKNTKKNFPQLISQQVQEDDIEIKPQETIQQNKNVTNNTNNFQNSNPFDQIFGQNDHQIDKEQNQPIKEHKPIPPPPKKGKPPVYVPKKKPNINSNYNQQKYLQDQNQKQKNISENEMNIKQIVEEKQNTLTVNNLQDQASNLMQNYLTTHNVQQFEQDVKQLRHQHHESFNQAEIKQVQSQELQQITESHHQMRAPPPPPKKSIKPKSKSRAIPKQINEANFYQQSSHSQSQEQAYQPQQAPQESQKYGQQEYQHNNSSEDFFANFGRTTTNSQQNLQSTYRNSYSSMMEVQQSSIDYADSHSVISSTAAQMLDSQYFPEQAHQPTIVEVAKMSKKKPNKRQQPKMLDPNSFA